VGVSDRPLVSIVLVTYNDERFLPEYFERLDQTTYEPWEHIAIDNGSSDSTLELLRARGERLTLIENETSSGFGTGCNQGARHSRGEYLVFMNADVWVTPDWLDRLVARMQEQPDAAIASPVTLPLYKQPQPADRPFLDVAAVPGCSMMMRRRAWEELGGFDERFFLTWEDTELCWRARLAGWRVLEDQEAHVWHLGRGNWRRWAGEELHNGLYTHIKLMRWRAVAPFVVMSLARTAAKLILLRDRSLLRAWSRLARELRATLAQRRRWTRDARRSRTLERLVGEQRRRRRRERLEEWRMGRAADAA
jgi:N-acetylglucosaminyl-diphospho-decaprenol L-rhamnosyltransferase